MNKFKIYRVISDFESGEWSREFIGHVYSYNEEQAIHIAAEKFETHAGELRAFTPGTRVKLSGYMSNSWCRRDANRHVDNMCQAERNAYYGR